ncbi:MAG: ATP-binding cassette domain-containing protein, partial [Paraclostridium bifermentans]
MLLEVKNLKIKFKNNENYTIDDINLDVKNGEIISLVGESGSGKSLTSLAIMKLISANAEIEGTIKFEGRDLLDLNEKDMCDIRGNERSMIFQEPMIALN